MMTQPFRNRASGFTLIEMMTVVVIIIVLAALTVAGMGYVNDKRARAKAQIDIKFLSKAIEEYKADMGQYPGVDGNTAVEGLVSEELYEALFLNGYDSQASGDGSVEIYLPQLDPRDGKQSWVEPTNTATPGAELRKIYDPWLREYRYRKGDNAQNPDFDLWSSGKDGQTNPQNPDMTLQENRDDVRNF